MLVSRFLFVSMTASLAALALLQTGCGNYEAEQPATSPPAAATSLATPAKLPVWESDKAFEEQLEPYQDVAGYQIRIPKDYEPVTIPQKMPSTEMTAWGTQPRADGTRAAILLIIATMPPGSGDSAASDEQVLEGMLNGFRATVGQADWQQTPIERGQISGMPFLRVGWQSTAKQAPVKMHGFYYLSREGEKCLVLVISDAEPHHEESLNLQNAAVRTVRKK
jgi:hypothetical protein